MRILLLLALVQACFSYKFLVYSPLFGHSHTTFLAKIADTLSAAGHEVTFFIPVFDETQIGKKNVSLTKDVIQLPSDPRVAELMRESHKIIFKQLWEMSPDVMGLLKMAKNFTKSFTYACDGIMKNETLLADLTSRKYDVGIAEPFSVCGFGLFDILGISSIGALSNVQLDLVSWYMGEPLAPSYVPSMSSVAGEKMTFFDRAKNFIATGLGFKFNYDTFEQEFAIMQDQLSKDLTGPGDLISKCSFMFTNANPYLNYPRPLLHKTLEIGGITIDTKNPGSVGTKWDTILNERRHNVFISFGSVAKSKDMPEHWKKSILEVCASLPDVTFIWKYEDATTIADHLPNVHLAPWLPQNALLADERLSIFITHGGLGSTTEVAYLGKPAIMIPLFADQPRNAEMLARHGGAITLNKMDIQKPEIVRKAIVTMLEDPGYAAAAAKLANMFKEQPISAKELVVRYSEFVAKFGHLKHLEPYGRHLSTIQYYLLDVIIVFIAVLIALLIVVLLLLRWIYRKLGRSQKTKRE